jgi:hypothetical protein
MFDPNILERERVAPPKRRTHPAVMVTGAQIRAARGLLGWSASRLARAAGCALRTVQRAEVAVGIPQMQVRTVERIQAALEAAGCEFIPESQASKGGGPGVRIRR